MTPRMSGIEVEYACAIPGRGGAAPSAPMVSQSLLKLARQHLRHLPDSGGTGLFLLNGSRFYVDTGHHPEFCTPEVDHPDDCVLYSLACESILGDLARELSAKLKSQVIAFKCNVDYTKHKVTWACHESYLHRAPASSLPRQLIPHFVTRTYCCAGGLNPSCPAIEFSLSPRIHTFETEVSRTTTGSRGIFNTRDESHSSRGYRRLHVICCDSLCSQTSLWLRVATTCLVLAMAEAGLNPGEAVQLRQSVQAMHLFATDPYFRTTAELADGRRRTAVQIQRHYLERAEAHLDHDCMPPWAEEVCRRWRAMLDRLEQGPAAVEQTLDWAIKYPIFLDHLRRGGVDPDSLPHWKKALNELRDSLRRGDGPRRLTADLILDNGGPLRESVRRLGPYLKAHGLHWDQVRDLLRLRAELCEIDMRFGQVEPKGIFSALEPQLDHGIIDVTRIAEARSSPPQTTRARLRGEQVRCLAGKRRCSAGWTYVRDGKGRRLDLSDPFGRNARWEILTDGPSRPDLAELHAAISRAYNLGDFERVHQLLQTVMAMRSPLGPRDLDPFLPYLAWVESRRGRLERSVAVLDEMAAADGGADSLAKEYVAVYRFQGLAPNGRELWTWIERADRLMEQVSWGRAETAAYLGHKGYVLARSGSLEQAQSVLRSVCAARYLASAHQRIAARNMADLGDVLRIRGKRDEASRWLDKAQAIYESHGFSGEEADFLLTYRAKLEDDLRNARALLRKAKAVQRRFSNRIGLTRTLLLEARLSPTKVTAERRKREVMELRDQVPDLGRCPLLARILDRWTDWANGSRCPDPVTEGGDFFWLL